MQLFSRDTRRGGHAAVTFGSPKHAWPRAIAFALFLALTLAPAVARAGTLVSMNFANFGTVQVDLFDDLVSTTVNNFVQNYVNTTKYNGTMVHRVDTGLGVIQGGGYLAANGAGIQTSAQIPLQYSRANTRGTISMARLGGANTATATSQWFINTDDNTTSLGASNGGGYAVFGWIVGPGMSVVDSIAAQPTYNYSDFNPNGTQRPQADRDALTASAAVWGLQNRNIFSQLPLQNFTLTDYSNGVNPLPHDVVLNFVTVIKTHPSFQNPISVTDVNNDGFLRASDVSAVNFDLLHNGFHNLTSPFAGTSYLDVNGDGRVNLGDSRTVINALLHAPPAASPQASPAMSIMSVPEPSSVLLGALALIALGGFAMRARLARRRRAGARV